MKTCLKDHVAASRRIIKWVIAMQIIAALLAGSMSSSLLNAVIGASIQRGDTAMNDGGCPTFARLPTNGDPGSVDSLEAENREPIAANRVPPWRGENNLLSVVCGLSNKATDHGQTKSPHRKDEGLQPYSESPFHIIYGRGLHQRMPLIFQTCTAGFGTIPSEGKRKK